MPVPMRDNAVCKTYHGYAAKDNDEQSRELLVYSEEALPFHQGINGMLDGVDITSEISTTGNRGAYEGQVNTTNCFRCIYRDDSSSGATPPLVRKGEQVLIYNYGDSSVWYWKSEGRNDNNRRTDLWRKAISGTLENAPELNDDNSYFIELDTRKTHRIRISTSKADNEEFRYLFMFDADNSQIFLGDDIGNQLFVDSKEHKVGLRNTDESLLLLDKKNIVMACDEDITITSKNGTINTDSKLATNINSQDALTMSSTADMKVKTEASMGITSAADMTQQAKGKLSQGADAGWAMNIAGGGALKCGGNLGFEVGHFDVKKG